MLVAVVLPLPAHEAQATAPPALGDGHTEGVRPRDELLGQVVGGVADAVAVGGPARGQELLADRLTVAMGVVGPEGTDVEASLGQAVAHIEGAAEPDRPLGHLVREVGRDRHGPPVRRIEQARLDREGRRPRAGFTVCAEHPQLHVSARTGGQRGEGPGHEHRRVTVDGRLLGDRAFRVETAELGGLVLPVGRGAADDPGQARGGGSDHGVRAVLGAHAVDDEVGAVSRHGEVSCAGS